jgi:hypothetical protein
MKSFQEMWEELNGYAQVAFMVLVAGLLIGAVILAWIDVLGPAFNQADYNNFNNSPQHLGAVAQQFSRDCLQIAQASDPTTKKAIEQDIYQAASTVDLSKVDMPDTTRACVSSAISDVTNNK